MRSAPGEQPAEQAAQCVIELAGALRDQLQAVTTAMHRELVEAIPELQGDPLVTEPLRQSVEGNLDTIAHMLQHGLAPEQVTTPPKALEYARMLAQRGIPPNAFVRAYRLGQERLLAWAHERITATVPDPLVALATYEAVVRGTFRFVEHVSETLITVYDEERERWLAQRNTARAAMVARLLADAPVDAGQGETALGYRLGRLHLGVVAWCGEREAGRGDSRLMEQALLACARALDGAGRPLLLPQDEVSTWAWFPLDPAHADHAVPTLATRVAAEGDGLHLAVGRPAFGTDGFRSTWRDARRAQEVAGVAGRGAARVTPYTDPEVRTAALLAHDLEATRELVRAALGGLAARTEKAAGLRDTLRIFLAEQQSHAATGERLHVHKNTVKYRVGKALEVRGRDLATDRLELELGLVACRWLGDAVLPSDYAS